MQNSIQCSKILNLQQLIHARNSALKKLNPQLMKILTFRGMTK